MKKKSLIFIAGATLLLSGCGGGSEAKDESSGTLPDLGDRYELDASTPAWQLDTKEDNKLTWYVNLSGGTVVLGKT
ncbi:hypothetical protein [Enterococcus sp. LJL90]